MIQYDPYFLLELRKRLGGKTIESMVGKQTNLIKAGDNAWVWFGFGDGEYSKDIRNVTNLPIQELKTNNEYLLIIKTDTISSYARTSAVYIFTDKKTFETTNTTLISGTDGFLIFRFKTFTDITIQKISLNSNNHGWSADDLNPESYALIDLSKYGLDVLQGIQNRWLFTHTETNYATYQRIAHGDKVDLFQDVDITGTTINKTGHGIARFESLTWNIYYSSGSWLFYATLPNGLTYGGLTNQDADFYFESNIYKLNQKTNNGSGTAIGEDLNAWWDATNPQLLIKDTRHNNIPDFINANAGKFIVYKKSQSTGSKFKNKTAKEVYNSISSNGADLDLLNEIYTTETQKEQCLGAKTVKSLLGDNFKEPVRSEESAKNYGLVCVNYGGSAKFSQNDIIVGHKYFLYGRIALEKDEKLNNLSFASQGTQITTYKPSDKEFCTVLSPTQSAVGIYGYGNFDGYPYTTECLYLLDITKEKLENYEASELYKLITNNGKITQNNDKIATGELTQIGAFKRLYGTRPAHEYKIVRVNDLAWNRIDALTSRFYTYSLSGYIKIIEDHEMADIYLDGYEPETADKSWSGEMKDMTICTGHGGWIGVHDKNHTDVSDWLAENGDKILAVRLAEPRGFTFDGYTAENIGKLVERKTNQDQTESVPFESMHLVQPLGEMESQAGNQASEPFYVYKDNIQNIVIGENGIIDDSSQAKPIAVKGGHKYLVSFMGKNIESIPDYIRAISNTGGNDYGESIWDLEKGNLITSTAGDVHGLTAWGCIFNISADDEIKIHNQYYAGFNRYFNEGAEITGAVVVDLNKYGWENMNEYGAWDNVRGSASKIAKGEKGYYLI